MVRLRGFEALLRIAVVATVFAIACTSPTEAPGPTTGVSGAQPSGDAAVAPALSGASSPVPARPAAPTREQTLRVPLTEPPTIDPGLAEDNVSVEIIAQLFDPLVAFDDKGAINPVGAEKWEVSPDGLTYTFTLRQGPKWSDGKPVRAEDYAWAWRRNVSPATASPYANSLYPIKNALEINDGKLEPDQLGVAARDDRTLVVTLEKPAAYFLRLASTWTLMPLRQDVIDRFGDKWTEPQNIVTNGVYRLKEWRHDAQIVLERNDDYWGARPLLQKAIYRLFPEGGSDQVLAAYEANELDATGSGTSFELPPNQVDRILADPKLKSETIVFDQSATMFIAVNTRRPHLKDPRVRLALTQSLDRSRIITDVLKRDAQPALSLQPEGIAGRKPELWAKDDLATARRLLAEAGFPDGKGFPEITFAYNTSAQWKTLAEYLQQRWKETLGINVKLEAMEWAVFLKWRRGDEWTSKGDLFRGAWFSDYEDPNNWYNLLWDSQSDPLAFNSGWKNSQYDTIVRQAAGELDQTRRQELYAQAESILATEVPELPVFHYRIRSLVKPYVKGFTPERVLGITPLRRIELSDAR